ncbi:NAD-dependent epimerase/dehydratase family protein [Nocardia jiangxiensis]|uniref:NAD-dependent epimerase/dehydratase family protein n=1 Tax=Nocardia jiangxiensis TaxID=282685 RepID=UPI000310734D|nr:NAD-dependent epimerase/dehydratase family protein [Nocardia jiangxiensis]
MRVLVTGANGYVGRAVVKALSLVGHDPVAMVRSHGGDVSGASAIRVADLLDRQSLRRAVEGVDAVCHLAGLTRARESFANPIRYFEVNTAGTIALLDAMNRAGVHQIVFASTGAIYGSPDRQPMTEDLPSAPPHPYASSKLAAELAIEAQCGTGDLAAVVVRLLNVAGGDDGDPTRLVPRILAAITNNSDFAVNGNGTAVRDYLHIADAADAFAASVDHLPAAGQVATYNVGSGSGSSVAEVIAAAERVTGQHVSVVRRPAAAEPQVLISDPSRAIVELEWEPRRSSIDTIVGDAWAAMPAAQ